jgi:hypothetical protein
MNFSDEADFQGSDLYLAQPQGIAGIFAAGNTGLVMQNFTIDYMQPAFTQVKVVAVNPAQGQIQYTVQPGYRDPSVFNPAASSGTLAAMFFRDGQVVSGLNGLGRLNSLLPFTGNQITIALNQYFTPAVLQQIRPGDIAVVYYSGAAPIIVLNCTGCTLRNIRIYAGGGLQPRIQFDRACLRDAAARQGPPGGLQRRWHRLAQFRRIQYHAVLPLDSLAGRCIRDMGVSLWPDSERDRPSHRRAGRGYR